MSVETVRTPMTPVLVAAALLAQFYAFPVLGRAGLRAERPAAAARAAAEAPGYAAAPGSPQPAATGQEQPSRPSDDLAGAERLAIKFQGYPELTADYRVNSDETVSIPVLGRVSVARIGAAALEQILARMATEIAGRDSYVTVEIAAYRPIFVTGFVKNPGAVQWHPGLSVLQALALAGGPPSAGATQGPANEVNGASPVSPLLDSTRLRTAVVDQQRRLAALARLRAEQHGLATIDVPSKLVNLVGAAAAAALIADQQSLLTTRRTTLESQLATLERGKGLAGQELEAMRKQVARVDAQLRVQRERRQTAQEQQAKGLGRAQQGADQDAKVLDLEEKSTNLTVAIAKGENTIAGLERDASNLKLERQTAVDAEILKLEHESAQFDIDFETANGPPDKADEGAMPSRLAVRARSLTYEIIRQGTNAATKVENQFSSLTPGDILVVSQGEL